MRIRLAGELACGAVRLLMDRLSPSGLEPQDQLIFLVLEFWIICQNEIGIF
jgi:hypothetical protein